jgi:hypothetical protein
VVDAKFEALLAEEIGKIGEVVFSDFAVIHAVEGFKFEFGRRGEVGGEGRGITRSRRPKVAV